MPIDKPIRKNIKMIQRSGRTSHLSHLVAHQNINAVKQPDIDQTDASTAENHCESTKVNDKPAITPQASIMYILLSVSSPLRKTSLRAKKVVVQKANNMVNELNVDAAWFISGAALCTSPKLNNETKCCISCKNGSPGGWPTSSL